MKKPIFLLFSLLSLLTACDEGKDLSPVAMETSLRNNLYFVGGQKANFTVMATAETGELRSLSIKTEDSERGHVVFVDTLLSGTYFKKDYSYDVPYLTLQDTTVVKFTMEVTNTAGNEFSLQRTMNVISTDAPLKELSNLTLWTVEGDEHPNAFDITNKRVIYQSLEDSANIDIFIPEPDIDSQTEMVSELATNTDIRFARANSFDYSSATKRTLDNAFASAVTSPRIKGIKTNDVILFGRGNVACGVMKIIHAIDEPGFNQDRYVVSIKLCE